MRLHFLDTIRGIAFILMFIFHIFIAFNLFIKDEYNLNTPVLKYIGLIARILFILLLGISLYLSYINSETKEKYKKKQLQRSIQLLTAGIYVTIITYLVIPDKYVVFGILHFMAIAILLLYNFVNNIPILLIIFILIEFINLYINNTSTYTFNNDGSIITFIKGILGISFYKNTVDSFPILKWINTVIIGIFIGHFINYINILNNKNIKQKDKKIETQTNIINIIGKNTLLLYILHLPLLYIIMLFFKRF